MFRIAVIVVESSDGRLFAHQRRADKAVFPSLWGLGAGGRIEVGETPLQGATRELREETGLRSHVNAVDSFEFLSGEVLYEFHVYRTQSDDVIPNHDAEWQQSGWFAPHEIERMMGDALFCPDITEAYRRMKRFSPT